MQPKISTDYTC